MLVFSPEHHLGGVVVPGVGDGLDDGPVHQGDFTVNLSTNFSQFFQAVDSLGKCWSLSVAMFGSTQNSPGTIH